jgi:hypothetical protein
MAQFFTETFHRRTGKPLDYLVGDVRLAGIVALASADRPYLAPEPGRELIPWVSDADIRRKGAVLIWFADEGAGQPPDALKSRFPELVPELPRSFERRVQGRLPLFRIGWAVIRPGG